jgi:hypothetical protein
VKFTRIYTVPTLLQWLTIAAGALLVVLLLGAYSALVVRVFMIGWRMVW